MDVLLVESSLGLGREAEVALQDAGHTVVRCFGDAAGPSRPCAGLDPEGSCPLDSHEVAVAVLAHAGPELLAAEHGALCAARHRIPVVLAGGSDGPAMLSTAVFPTATPLASDLAAAIDEAATSGNRHAAAVTRELLAYGVVSRDELEGDTAAVAIDVRRRPGQLEMTIWLHEDDDRHAAIVRAAAEALRRYDPHTAVIDVTVRRTRSGAPVG